MTKLDFSYLVSPFNAADFFAQSWEKAALLMKRGDIDHYRRLFDVADADAVLAMASELPTEAVEVIGRVRTPETAVEQSTETSDGPTNALADLFNKGATIRVKAIERFCRPLGEWCKTLEAELGCPVRANLYCTPGNSHGFDLHFDTHEVFVLQLFGKKRWQIFEPAVRLPLEFVPPLPFENAREALQRAGGRSESNRDIRDDIVASELGPLALEALLEPGDCLYLPRGFVHQAAAEDEPSVHLSVGAHVLTWLDLWSVALGQVAFRHEDFRRALPVGPFRQPKDTSEFEKEFDALVKQFRSDAVVADAVSEMSESLARRASHEAPGRDARTSVDHHGAIGNVAPARIDTQTKLASNGALRFYLAVDGTMAGLACNGKELWLPAGFASALRFVTEQNEFRPDEIPGLVGDNGKLAFVRHLLKDGFVRVAAQ